MKILIVEDDAWQADCFKLWLGSIAEHIQIAASAQAALDMLDNFTPDVILLDMFLPGANGLQLISQLATYTDTQNIPLVLCSSAFPAVLPNLQHQGVRYVVDKTTAGPSQLRDVISKAVSAHAV